MGMLPDEEGPVLWLFARLSRKAFVEKMIVPLLARVGLMFAHCLLRSMALRFS